MLESVKDKIKTSYKEKRNLSKVNLCLILSTAYLGRVPKITRNSNQKKNWDAPKLSPTASQTHYFGVWVYDRSNRTREGDKNANEDHTASLLSFPPLLSGHPGPVY